MLILYSKKECPHCDKVKDFFKENKILFEEKKVDQNPDFREELLKKGKKAQVPFLVDNVNSVSMYESGKIILHVEENFL